MNLKAGITKGLLKMSRCMAQIQGQYACIGKTRSQSGAIQTDLQRSCWNKLARLTVSHTYCNKHFCTEDKRVVSFYIFGGLISEIPEILFFTWKTSFWLTNTALALKSSFPGI
jgi:hypothetical protein